VPSIFLALIVSYHLIFGQYFPAKSGTLGGDYSQILPNLLDGYFWIRNNGLFKPFWFTPAFCGGMPELGDPASIFYSTAQFLTLFFDPLIGIYASVLLFATLGFLGFYLLLRKCFDASVQAAVLGGALFMFNGFFAHRMMIGHYVYHSVMLAPGIAWLLLRPVAKDRKFANLLSGAAAGCLVAYGTYSGLVSIMLPFIISVLVIVCLHGFYDRPFYGFLPRCVVLLFTAIGLSSAKLVATISFLRNFPRSDYSLPGISGAWETVRLISSSLFISPPNIVQQALPLVANRQWALNREEWEYGVTVVPVFIILIGIVVGIRNLKSIRPKLNFARWAWLVLLGFFMMVPFALNIYTPGWNEFLKQLPLIKSSSTLLRWFLIYIPIVILISALLMDMSFRKSSLRNGVLACALIALVSINAAKDRRYYQFQSYRPDTINSAWKAMHSGIVEVPRINEISATFADNNAVQILLDRNDDIASGKSQLACNSSIFGYRLEHFPVKALHVGSVFEERNGLLNIKNPVCYVYPEQNNCAPGDHFTIAQIEAAQAFVSYKPYMFNFSFGQKIANLATIATVFLLSAFLVVAFFRKIR